MTRRITKNVASVRILARLLLLVSICALVADNVEAGSVAQVMEKKTLPEATIGVVDPETGASSGSGGVYGVKLEVGDIILFTFALTPAPYQEYRGIQSYLTEYIPENTEVVGVRITDADGNTITPRYPGLASYGCSGDGCPSFTSLPCSGVSPGCSGGFVSLSRGSIAQVHADTGIFFAADSEVRLARNPNDQFINMSNGTVMSPQPVYVPALIVLLDAGATVYAHNAWDWTQVKAFGISTAASGNSGKGETPFGYGSEVAGPETFYQYEATDVGGNIRFDDVVGPWNRIRYPGSKIGFGPADAPANDPATGLSYARMLQDPTGGQIGWDVTPMHPISAKALRFALGASRVGSPQFVEVALRVLALPLDPAFGGGPGEHVNCGEVVSANTAVRRASSVLNGEENPWSAYLASPSCVGLRLMLDLTGETDLAVLRNVAYTLRAKNLSVNDETNVRVELRWDDTEINYVSTDSGPAPDGPPSTCTGDSSSTCLDWTVGTLAPSEEVNVDLTFWAKDSGGNTSKVTVRYYSDQLPSPGYYSTRDIHIQQQVPSPTAILVPVADPTVTAATPGSPFALHGVLTNIGNSDGNFMEINPVLPSGWSLANNLIVVGGANVACASTTSNLPVCAFTASFASDESRTLAMTVNVPSGAATGLYDLDLQLWMEGVETYFDHIVTVPVGAVRTQKPFLDCPIGSTDPAVTGTSEPNADITLLFNLMERGNATSDPAGTWGISSYPSFGDLYGGLEVSALAHGSGKLPSERSDRCLVDPMPPWDPGMIFADGFESGNTSAWDCCPTATHHCAEAPPIGWNGPAAVHVGDASLPPQICSGDYPDIGTVAFTDLDVPAATCDCHCDELLGATCSGTGTLTYYAASGCAGSSSSWNVSSDCTTLGSPYPAGKSWTFSASAMTVTGGTCPSSLTANIPGASFDTRFTPCEGASQLPGCQAGFIYLPNPTEPFGSALCIWREGDFACPPGSTYNDRTIYHTEFADSRDCGSCACGSPVGDCINSWVDLTDSPSCGPGNLLGAIPGDGACVLGLAGPSVQAGVFNQVVNGSCVPLGGGVVGGVTQIGPVTVCCTTP